MEIDDYENDHDRERMEEDDDPNACEVKEGIFSSNKTEPTKKEKTKDKKMEKKSSSGCKSSSGKRSSKQEKYRRAVNPFIVFYLKYYFDNPSKKVTEVARAAAKLWCRMSEKDKETYIKVARAESARRQKSKDKRKKKC